MKLLILLLGISLLFAGCVQQTAEKKDTEKEWKKFQLKDIDGKTFALADFKGRIVLLESFAVWCPVCLEQQKEIKKLKERRKDIISISIDTDPNENEKLVLEHRKKNNFNWIFAVAPKEFTQMLIDEYGLGIVNAPGAPIILICKNQKATFLSSGLKRVEQLEKTIGEVCP